MTDTTPQSQAASGSYYQPHGTFNFDMLNLSIFNVSPMDDRINFGLCD